jgi:hypothetical protein
MFCEPAAPSQMALRDFKDVPHTLIEFEMSTVIFLFDCFGERPLLRWSPYIRSWLIYRDPIIRVEILLSVLTQRHFYNTYDTVTVQIAHNFGA